MSVCLCVCAWRAPVGGNKERHLFDLVVQKFKILNLHFISTLIYSTLLYSTLLYSTLLYLLYSRVP